MNGGMHVGQTLLLGKFTVPRFGLMSDDPLKLSGTAVTAPGLTGTVPLR